MIFLFSNVPYFRLRMSEDVLSNIPKWVGLRNQSRVGPADFQHLSLVVQECSPRALIRQEVLTGGSWKG